MSTQFPFHASNALHIHFDLPFEHRSFHLLRNESKIIVTSKPPYLHTVGRIVRSAGVFRFDIMLPSVHSNPHDLVVMGCSRSSSCPSVCCCSVQVIFLFNAVVSKHSYFHHRNLPIVFSFHLHKHSPQSPATYSGSQTKVSAPRNIAGVASVEYLEVNSHSEGFASGATRGLRGHLKPQFLEGVVEERRCSEQQREAYQKWCSTC